MPSHLPVAERRRRLIDAAVTVARRDGLPGVTVRAVADEAGVATGVVHYCFVDKNELLGALASRLADKNAFGSVVADIQSLDPGSSQSGRFEVAARALLQTLWEAAVDRRADQLATYELITLSFTDPAAAAGARAHFDVGQRAAERLLQDLADATGVMFRRPVADVAAEGLLWFDGMLLRWLVDHDDEQVARRLDGLVQTLVQNLAPVTTSERVDLTSA